MAACATNPRWAAAKKWMIEQSTPVALPRAFFPKSLLVKFSHTRGHAFADFTDEQSQDHHFKIA
jgi:hypothetical protein